MRYQLQRDSIISRWNDDIGVFLGWFHVQVMHGSHRSHVLLNDTIQSTPPLLHVSLHAANETNICICIYVYFNIHIVHHIVISKYQDSFYNDYSRWMYVLCACQTTVSSEVVSGDADLLIILELDQVLHQ